MIFPVVLWQDPLPAAVLVLAVFLRSDRHFYRLVSILIDLRVPIPNCYYLLITELLTTQYGLTGDTIIVSCDPSLAATSATSISNDMNINTPNSLAADQQDCYNEMPGGSTEPGHSRNSSSTSQMSRASGYSSINSHSQHSRQSSSGDSGHIRLIFFPFFLFHLLHLLFNAFCKKRKNKSYSNIKPCDISLIILCICTYFRFPTSFLYVFTITIVLILILS